MFIISRRKENLKHPAKFLSCPVSSTFNLRVPGPQDGERGPPVCWVAGSFLQRDLGQCLPQPHGRHHCVRDLQAAWLWGQWNPQLFCWSQGRFQTPLGTWNPLSENWHLSLAVSFWPLELHFMFSRGGSLYRVWRWLTVSVCLSQPCRMQWDLIF